MKGTDVLFSSLSSEWLTPVHVLDQITAHFGQINLDPCAETHANPNVAAGKHFTKEDDGLKREWLADTVYVNPPYGRQIGQWTRKLLEERQHYREAITLLPARVDTVWWDQLLEAEPVICLVKGRLTFHVPHPGDEGPVREDFADSSAWGDAWEAYEKALKAATNPDPAPFPSALIYIGERRHAFADRFEAFGRIYTLY